MLPNGLRLHLAHDPAASRAAAWLRVAAGSHDEPSAHPGLAHFLEHLSFLGGAAFPGDERLMPWLQVRGGQVNASTRGRTTDYFFEVTAEHLGAGLARLIDMLARPLLDIDAQRREREVLEAEYLARSADEQTLIDAALALGLPAGHPCGVSLPGAATAWPWRTMRSSGPCANSMPPTITPAIASYGCMGQQALDELERLAQRACADLPGRAPGASPPPPPLLPFAGEALALRLPGPPRLVLGFALDALREADEQTLQAFARIARRSLAGRVAGSTRRTGPGRIGGAAGGSPGCAAGAPGVDLRTVRRQRSGGAGGGLFRLAGRPARRCRQPAGGAPAVAGGAHCTAGTTTPARSLACQRRFARPAWTRCALTVACGCTLDSELDGAEARWSAGFRLSVAPVAAAPPLTAQRHAWRFELPSPPSAAAEGALFLALALPGVPVRSRFLALRQALRPLCGQARLGVWRCAWRRSARTGR